MAVDPSLPRKVLIVHGVQTGPDNLNQDTLVEEEKGTCCFLRLCSLERGTK